MFKKYLVEEDTRNRKHHHVYERFLRLAVGQGAHILVAHHLTFELPVADGDDGEPNEIPSADTMMFCHVLMDKAFGVRSHDYMLSLAAVPVEVRDGLFEDMVIQEEERRDDAKRVRLNPCISGS